ncbi:hypothetical protein [Pedobacter gandavensis]|uniref:hypothetical protein n=1 Tax=Pedobacter gandavensis TaxID=2679963 RepID=UPI00292D8959|nr:hypothetical protein [Pedobacter gandavensis]
MLTIQRISKLDSKLSWFQLFFIAFPLKWKLELIAYSLIGIALFVATFASIPMLKPNTWITILFAMLTGLMTWPLLLRSSKFSMVILRRLCIQNNVLVPNISFHNFYGLRVILVKKELIECGALTKVKIEELVAIFAGEANVPRYPYWAHKIFKSVFFIVLGSLITFLFKGNGKESLESFWGLFSTVMVLLLLIVLLIYIIEQVVLRDVYQFWVKKHYRVDLVRYLNEVKMMI